MWFDESVGEICWLIQRYDIGVPSTVVCLTALAVRRCRKRCREVATGDSTGPRVRLMVGT